MPTLAKCRTRHSWAGLVGLLIACPAAIAQVRLDRLVACEEVADIYHTVRSGRPADHSCHDPQNTLDRLLVRKLGGSTRLCFESWPEPILRDFSCFVDVNNPGGMLTCMRAAHLADVRAYKAASDKERGAPGAGYGTQAQQCRIYHGDVGPMQTTLIPLLLAPIARMEFGFIASLGQRKQTTGYVAHGFASIDPSLSDDPDALEFVYFLTDQTVPPLHGKRDAIGRYWWLDVDDDKAFDTAMKANFRPLPLASEWDSTTFNLEQRYGATSKQSLQEVTEVLYDRIVASLKVEGFEQVDLSGPMTGPMGTFDLVRVMKQSIPYGLQEVVAVDSSPRVATFTKDFRGICPGGGDSGYIAMILAHPPDANPDRSMGTIGLEFAALGNCPRLSARARSYIEQLRSDAEILVREYLAN